MQAIKQCDTITDICVWYIPDILGGAKRGVIRRTGQSYVGSGGRKKIDMDFREKMLELSLNVILQMNRVWRYKNTGLWEEVSIQSQDLTDVLSGCNVSIR